MARGLFMLVCLLLALAVQHGIHTASATRTDETDLAPKSWRKAIIDQLSGIKDTLAEGQRSSCGESYGAVIAQLAAMQKAIDTTQYTCTSSVASMKEDLQKNTFRIQKAEEELQVSKDLGLKTDQGSTFVRWGRTTCPASTTLVYSGVAAGKHYNQKGSGTNTLCLPSSPQFDNTPEPKHYGYLYGGEYEHIPGHHENDVPCCVCRVPLSTTIMMAATHTCPQGWTVQYRGHLTSQYHEFYANEYVCLDGQPEDLPGGKADDDGRLFYYIVTKCGNLPCPPYADNKVVTCVVCSK